MTIELKNLNSISDKVITSSPADPTLPAELSTAIFDICREIAAIKLPIEPNNYVTYTDQEELAFNLMDEICDHLSEITSVGHGMNNFTGCVLKNRAAYNEAPAAIPTRIRCNIEQYPRRTYRHEY